ncbi:synaptonemal complex central element protein 2 [Protopterus annectens]|uniref:synaptonemal complex central element protein 2 n=1 Tax=Protopterus annectens TaxID=7888 RepID=UPI001CFB8395|nr:synaptonemal complex central element protein 2 [Protopterus annectens]XP_043940615.1 synaptonemal complex central element protein 2 [Protopterus annectens]
MSEDSRLEKTAKEVRRLADGYVQNEDTESTSKEMQVRNRPYCSTSEGASGSEKDVAAHDGKSVDYFEALNSNLESLQQRAQQLIDEINESRKKDHTLMSNFRENLMLKVSELSQKLEEGMYEIYDHHNKLIQDTLHELPVIMERIAQLEADLKQVCQTVVTVYKDICVQPEM